MVASSLSLSLSCRMRSPATSFVSDDYRETSVMYSLRVATIIDGRSRWPISFFTLFSAKRPQLYQRCGSCIVQRYKLVSVCSALSSRASRYRRACFNSSYFFSLRKNLDSGWWGQCHVFRCFSLAFFGHSRLGNGNSNVVSNVVVMI